MTTPAVADQATDSGFDGLKGISSRIPRILRRPVGANKPRVEDDLERNKRAPPSNLSRQTTVLMRRKLPWLDGQSKTRMPGHFGDSKESLDVVEVGAAQGSPPPVPPKDPSRPVPGGRPLLPALEPERSLGRRMSLANIRHDPALRPTGSTPSLRQRKRSDTRHKSRSLNSHSRQSVRPTRSKLEAQKALGMVNEGPRVADYASSEYSATSSDKDELPPIPTKAKSRPTLYDYSIDKQVSTASDSQSPHVVHPQWLQTQLDLSLQPEVSPRSGVPPPVRAGRSTCSSCGHDAGLTQAAPAKRLPRHRTASLPIESSEAPQSPMAPPATQSAEPTEPPTKLTKKPTLFAMPTHLLSSSTSQSTSPDFLASAQQPQRAAPVQPCPTARATNVARRSPSLTRAVTGLEQLMEEALNVARNAGKNGRSQDVAGILDNATSALRKSHTVQGDMNAGKMTRPLQVSPGESGPDSDSGSDFYSGAPSMRSGRRSVETAPTMFTKSAQTSQQPIVVDRYKPNGQSIQSMKGRVQQATSPVRGSGSSDEHSISHTPPRLYQPASADSIVRDFAYARAMTAKAEKARQLSKSYGAAADYYGDAGQSVGAQPGVRPSISAPTTLEKPLPEPPRPVEQPAHRRRRRRHSVHEVQPVSTTSTLPKGPNNPVSKERQHLKKKHHEHLAQAFQSSHYRFPQGQERGVPNEAPRERGPSVATDNSAPAPGLRKNVSLRHPRRKHISLKEGQGFSLGRYHRRAPIAREWNVHRKRIAACIACLNTIFVGLITGIYAGEVPRIQYLIADQTHKVILGNVLLFATLGAVTLIFWPLPLLHGRKPYTLLAFALMLPLMFPQALAVSSYRDPNNPIYRAGLLVPRAFQGVAMGFANINFLPTLFDLFGASLMSEQPHQEIVVTEDVRRQGGGIGVWLGIWSFSFVGSMSIGFALGAFIISSLDPSWGFYIVVIMLAFFLLVNVIAPETRRAPYRRSIGKYLDDDERIKRRVARGEVKLHISNDGPKWWWQEVWAGLVLTKRMVLQPGFAVLMLYVAWLYAQVTLVILCLGALLSRDYRWPPQYIGLAVLTVAIGAGLAVPLSKGNLFSRARDTPQRTDSMTMRPTNRIHWSSHMLRRCIFTLTLPFAALAYTLSSPGPSINWAPPTVFCGIVGFLSNLALAECVGIMMETFDTCDLQPGVNQKHRLQSLAETTRRRRTNYSSFPRICAGFFAAQALGFFLSAAATGVSGDVTRAVGAQTATAIVAAILLVLTLGLILVVYRWKEVQVIRNSAFGAGKNGEGGIDWGPNIPEDPEWKPVVIGNPSGKMRRVNLLELGSLSRWTEIRRLNKLIRD